VNIGRSAAVASGSGKLLQRGFQAPPADANLSPPRNVRRPAIAWVMNSEFTIGWDHAGMLSSFKAAPLKNMISISTRSLSFSIRFQNQVSEASPKPPISHRTVEWPTRSFATNERTTQARYTLIRCTG
jgi:hypothetical protein